MVKMAVELLNPARAAVRAASLCVLAMLLALGPLGCGGGDSSDSGEAVASESQDGQQAQAQASEGDDSDSEQDKSDDEENSEKKPRERTTSVNVALAYEGDLIVPVIAEGTVRARHEAEIHTELSGRIVRLYVDDGDEVRRGQLIAKLDDREYEMAYEGARAEYLKALSVLAIEDDSLQTIERPPELQAQIDELERQERAGKISREERLVREITLDLQALKEGSFRGNIASARSGVATARANVERARLDLEKTEIRAPFTGVVIGRLCSTGELVTVNQVLCTLVNNVDIEANVGVLESDIGKIAVGHRTLVTVPALKDTIQAQVDVISPQFDRESRTCEVLIRVTNEKGLLRPGMFVRAVIAGETFTNRLLVPKEAILTRDGRPLLFKVEDDRAKWLYVQLGEQNDAMVEIERVLQGGTLGEGDPVIVSDHLTLAHDAKVKVKKTVPVRDPWAGE